MASKKSQQRPLKVNKSKPSYQAPDPAQKQRLLIALAIAVFGFLLYANTIGHGYVLDDFSLIKENFITKRGIAGIPDLWTHHSRHGYWNSPGELYRPVVMTMFALEWQIMPDTPKLSHFLNILLYGLSGGLLFLTLAEILKKYNVLLPLLATLFFVAHPAHVEVVANIKGRDEIVMFLFATLSINLLWKHLKTNDLKWFLLSLGAYFLALFSKENGVTFVAIFPLVMWFFSKQELPKIALKTLPYAGLALIFIVARSKAIGDVLIPGDTSVLDNFLVATRQDPTKWLGYVMSLEVSKVISEFPGAWLANAFLMMGKYLMTLLFPYRLGSDFGYNQIPLTGWGDWRVLLSFAAWSGMLFFAFMKLKTKSLWAFCILFFLINFSIFSNIFIKIGTSYGDRLLYSASPGFALALALGLMKIFKIDENEKLDKAGGLFQNKLLWSVAGIILLFYSFKTITRNPDWKTSYSLYEADVATAPNSAKLNFHYGLEIIQKGLDEKNPQIQKQIYARGRAQFEKAIQIYPSYHDAYSQLGLCYYRENNYDKALENYHLALKYKPNFPLVYSNMGKIYYDIKKDFAKAKECYENAIKYDPRFTDALMNLGAVYANQGQFAEAIKYFRQGLEYDPNHVGLNRFLGMSLRDSGQPEQGRPFMEKADRLEKSK